ncbi:hypothetical protein BC567DRAFT_237496 [Phyllosticta citribraziliensis]
MSLAKSPAAVSSHKSVSVVLLEETQTTTTAPPKSPGAKSSNTRLQQLQEAINGIAEARVQRLEQAVSDLIQENTSLKTRVKDLEDARVEETREIAELIPDQPEPEADLERQPDPEPRHHQQTQQAPTAEERLSALQDVFHASASSLHEDLKQLDG